MSINDDDNAGKSDDQQESIDKVNENSSAALGRDVHNLSIDDDSASKMVNSCLKNSNSVDSSRNSDQRSQVTWSVQQKSSSPSSISISDEQSAIQSRDVNKKSCLHNMNSTSSSNSSLNGSPVHSNKLYPLPPAIKHTSNKKENYRNQRSLSLGSASDSLFSLNNMSSSTNSRIVDISSTSNEDKVVLVVENTRFIVDRAMLVSKPDTMLGRMFNATSKISVLVKPNANNEYHIAYGISSVCFQAIMEYYRCGKIRCSSILPISELREACDYLLIPFNSNTVHSYNLRSLLHEFSNDGAKQQFNNFLDNIILPQMIVSTENGDRECHIVILLDDDVVDWDELHPPHMGEDTTQVVYSTQLYRFFRYVENRDIAKEILQERGLKKIRLGIEGYPTHKERIKRRFNRSEVIYSYVQRPFVHCSWEKEEGRSRHVDFACPIVKSKSNPSLASAASDPLPQPAPLQSNTLNPGPSTASSFNYNAFHAQPLHSPPVHIL